MSRIIGIGESVLDIVIKGRQPQSANPGGSAFNSIISLGRCGLPCCFLTELGQDQVAQLTLDFMRENGVDAGFVTRIAGMKSKVSLAFLNEENEARYQFYRDPEPENLFYHIPEIHPGDFVLLSSFYAVNPAIRYRVAPFLQEAREKGALIYYDVNFRPNHAGSLPAVMGNVRENFSLAHVVRGSVDDFQVLFGETDGRVVYDNHVKPFCPYLILTDGPRAVRVYTPAFQLEFESPRVETVSTIGAGDNFNAGFICSLWRKQIQREHIGKLDRQDWTLLIRTAQQFATEVCRSMDNYVSEEFGKEMQ